MSTTRKSLVLSSIILLMGLGVLLVAPQAWATGETYAPCIAPDLRVQVAGETYEFEGSSIVVSNVTSGQVNYDKSTKTLTLSNVKMGSVDLDGCKKLTVKLVGKNVANGRFIDDYYGTSSVTVVGPGSVNGNLAGGKSVIIESGDVQGWVECDKLTIAGGSISKGVVCYNDAVVNGGKVSNDIECHGNLTVNGGSIVCANLRFGPVIDCKGKLFVNGGSIRLSKCVSNQVVSCGKEIVVNGGDISLKNCEGTGIDCKGLTVKKGSVAIDNQNAKKSTFAPSIYIRKGSLSMTGGLIKVTRSTQEAIYVKSPSSRTSANDGTIRITGGKLIAKVRKPSSDIAIKANNMVCKVSLKGVKGGIEADGATFVIGGNTYESTREAAAKLIKYNSEKTKAKLSEVIFGGYTYPVGEISSRAFATKNGAKVTSLTLGDGVEMICPYAFKGAKSLKVIHLDYLYTCEIGNYAFSGTTALTKLEFREYSYCPFERLFNNKGELKTVKWANNMKVAKKAFAKCGKNGGSALKVSFSADEYGVPASQAKAYRKLFVSHGMSKKFGLQAS